MFEIDSIEFCLQIPPLFSWNGRCVSVSTIFGSGNDNAGVFRFYVTFLYVNSWEARKQKARDKKISEVVSAYVMGSIVPYNSLS